MDWKTLIAELTDRSKGGFTQAALAEKCGCGQSTISEIGRGIITSPNFELGQKLVALHAAHKINAAA
jgi:transcriptional regulator with XRE-family HTH domain